MLTVEQFNLKYDAILRAMSDSAGEYASIPVTDEEQKYIIERLKGSENEPDERNETPLQRQLDDLKIREYNPD